MHPHKYIVKKLGNQLRHKLIRLFVIGIVIFSVITSFYLYQLARIASAYKAKILCSGMFVSGRTEQSLLSADVAVDDLALMRYINARVDRSTRQVTANFFGLAEMAARYRPGLGCTQMHAGFDFDTTLATVQHSGTDQSEALLVDNSQSTALNEVLDWAFSEPDPGHLRRTRAIVIMREGNIIAERYAAEFNSTTPLIGWSMSKSVINALVGILVQRGQITLDTPSPVAAWQKDINDPRAGITLSHLLHMTSGLAFDEDYSNPLVDVTRMLLLEPDKAAFAARQPLIAEVGTMWHYSSGNTNIIAGIMKKILGDDAVLSFPRQHLFEPLGMDSALIEIDASGTFVGSSFVYASARDWARFGQLYLQDGMWQGRRILPRNWVRYTTTPVPLAPNRQYGAHFWLRIPDPYNGHAIDSPLPKDAFHAIGHEGQFLSIIPSQRLVIVRMGLTRYAKAWQHDIFLRRILDSLAMQQKR